MLLLPILLSFGLISNAFAADDCSAADYRSKIPGPLHALQGSTKWCQSYAAAKLLSFKLKTAISGADIAMSYNDTYFHRVLQYITGSSETITGGGVIGDAIRSSAKIGFCSEQKFSSANRFHEIESFENSAEAIYRLRNSSNASYLKMKDSICQYEDHNDQGIFKMLNFYEKLKIFETSSRSNVIRRMRDVACMDRIPMPENLKIVEDRGAFNLSENQRRKMVKTIDDQLNKNNIVAVGIDANVYGFFISGPHAAVIAGRFRDDDGICRYIMIDSQDDGTCSNIRTKIQGESYGQSTYCDKGIIMVTRDGIQDNLITTTYIDSTKAK